MTAVGRAAARQTPPNYCCKLPMGEICVTQEPSHQLLCLTLGGELRNVVDPAGELLQFPTGVACDGASLFVADGLGDRIYRLRVPDFQLITMSDETLGLHYAHGVCLHDDGGDGAVVTLFVADWGNHRLLALDPATLALRYVLGRKGRAPGDLMYPRGVASLPNDEILVADTDNHRLQVLHARSGAPIRQIGGVEQPYTAVPAPGPGGEGLAFVATMGGRLCILPIHDSSSTGGTPSGTPLGTPSGSPAGSPARRGGRAIGGSLESSSTDCVDALAKVGRVKDVPMPSGGRLLCGICADERRVLVAGLDEERQLHLLAARPNADDGASRPGSARRPAAVDAPPSVPFSVPSPGRSPTRSAGSMPSPVRSFGAASAGGGGAAAVAPLSHAVDLLRLDVSDADRPVSRGAARAGRRAVAPPTVSLE